MDINKAYRRDSRRQKRNEMVKTGMSVFTIQEIEAKRANKIKQKKSNKNLNKEKKSKNGKH